MCKYSQLSLNTFALHSGRLMHTHQRAGGAAAQQLSARKYSNGALNTYPVIAQRWRFLQKKIAELLH